MKRIMLTLVTILFCSLIATAQKRSIVKLNIGPELAFPTGDFSNFYSFGIGGTAQVEIPLQEKLQGVAYGGVVFYNGKSAGSGLKNKGVTIIPIRIGLKQFLAGSIYGAVQAGLGIIGGPDAFSGTTFSYSPQIGYEFNSKSGKAIDASFKYDAYTKSGTISSLGFRIGFVL